MEVIKIRNCQICPFANNDNEYGYDRCNLIDIELVNWEELPEDKVHEKCPLKTKSILVKLE